MNVIIIFHEMRFNVPLINYRSQDRTIYGYISIL